MSSSPINTLAAICEEARSIFESNFVNGRFLPLKTCLNQAKKAAALATTKADIGALIAKEPETLAYLMPPGSSAQNARLAVEDAVSAHVFSSNIRRVAIDRHLQQFVDGPLAVIEAIFVDIESAFAKKQRGPSRRLVAALSDVRRKHTGWPSTREAFLDGMTAIRDVHAYQIGEAHKRRDLLDDEGFVQLKDTCEDIAHLWKFPAKMETIYKGMETAAA
jgi:hypothetical protein